MEARSIRSFTAIIERDRETGLYVGYVPELPGAHSQGATIDELREHIREAVELVLGSPGYFAYLAPKNGL